jgi:phosphatidylinositol alpha-1,6-mannosyltransferase
LLQEFPDVTYLIVGDGPDMERLVGKAAALGITGNVVFAGKVLESKKRAHHRLADVFVMPSFGEGFGIVLLEAAAKRIAASHIAAFNPCLTPRS